MICRKHENIIGDVGHIGALHIQSPMLLCTIDTTIYSNDMDFLFLFV